MKNKGGYVYILTSRQNGTLYIGVTSNLTQRIDQHRQKSVHGFTEKYSVMYLVWYERHDSIESAILREKQLKKWNRGWKLRIIEEQNPEWKDLANDYI